MHSTAVATAIAKTKPTAMETRFRRPLCRHQCSVCVCSISAFGPLTRTLFRRNNLNWLLIRSAPERSVRARRDATQSNSGAADKRRDGG